MATNILMPALSPTMTEGTLARWLKKEGDAVRAGDIIAEIETDKATMEVEAVDEGVLARILVPDGTEGVKVNDPIAVLTGEGEDAAPGGAAAAEPAPSASGGAALAAIEATGGEVVGAPEQPVTMDAPPAAAAAPRSSPAAAPGGEGRVIASPLARRMAQQAGLDLGSLSGSGPNGRIVKADVEAAAAKGSAPKPAPADQAPAPTAPAASPPPSARPAAAPAPSPAAAPAPAPKPAPAITAPHDPVPNSSMRKVIARRLSEAKSTIPHFYVAMDIELDALLKLRADLNARSPKDGPGAYKLSVNDLIIKAAAVALRQVPGVNASWSDDAILRYRDVDIAVAVSIPDGLITPIVRQADTRGLAAISHAMKDLGARAKAGKLKPDEFQGGGFSISNMGMYGVKDFAAIINPPQAGILAVGAGEQRAVVKGGALAVATVMTCQLSVDHRVIDGALAAEWLGVFKRLVEDPLGLLL